MQITSWHAPFNEACAADLLPRLRQVRWSDAVTDDWSQGTAPLPLRELVAYWVDGYDWHQAAARIKWPGCCVNAESARRCG